MQQFNSTSGSPDKPYARVVTAADEQPRMLRGVVNGMLLSSVVWVAAGYLAFILR